MSPKDISEGLNHLQKEAGFPQNVIWRETVDRLRFHIIQNVQNHPDAEKLHWNRVREPYGSNEKLTIKNAYIPQWSGPVTETQPTDPWSSSGNREGSQQPQSSRQRGGDGGR